MRVLIFEPDFGGHRMQYVRVLADSLTQITDEVIVVTDVKASASEEFTVHLAPIKSCVKLEYSYKSTNGNALRIAFNKAQALYDAISRHRPHHVYVPYADGVTQVLGLCRLVKNNILTKGEIEIEGLLMGGRFAYPREHWYDLFFNQARITATELSPFHIIHHLDPIPFEALKKRGGKLAKISRLVPEPVEPIIPIASAEARRILGIPVDGRYIGCVGVLEGYKGIDRILRAFAEAKLEAVDRLLFVGRLAEDVRKILTSELTPLVKGKRIITMYDRYLTQEEFFTALQAMDVVCATYPKHIGSSGIVVRAAAAHKPLLASDYGWVGMVVSRFGLGRTCNVNDKTDFTAGITASVRNSSKFMLTKAGHRFNEFHTIENYSAHMTARLRERLKLPPQRDLKTWDWVLQAVNMH